MRRIEKNRWSIFWHHFSKDIAAGKVVFASPFLALFAYYGFYHSLKVGGDLFDTSVTTSCAAIGFFLICHSGLIDRSFLKLHIENLKLLAVSAISLVLVEFNASLSLTTFIGAMAMMICAVKYPVEQVILEAERARAKEERKSRKT
ncbi:hypothetical protein [Microbulbifer sp. JMSA003]|uniref:hypothetical protein n=1 Tax=Microbulbifer sp. JMSA003 TaxID=3243369 RepID=UPI004039C452